MYRSRSMLRRLKSARTSNNVHDGSWPQVSIAFPDQTCANLRTLCTSSTFRNRGFEGAHGGRLHSGYFSEMDDKISRLFQECSNPRQAEEQKCFPSIAF